MENNIKLCRGIIGNKSVNSLIKIINKLPFERLRKNKYAETWSSSTDEDVACQILEIIGYDALRTIAENVAKFEGNTISEKTLEISNFTVVRLSGVIPGLAWHRDSYYDSSINKFIGIEPYGYKAYISLNNASGLETIFAPSIKKDKLLVNSLLKSIYITINPFIKKIRENVGLGDVMIFRTDVMHKRPWCLFGRRDAIIISYVRSKSDLIIYKADKMVQDYYRKLICS